MEINEDIINSVKDAIQMLVEENDLENALEQLKIHIAPISKSLKTSITLNTASFNETIHQETDGLLTTQETKVEKAKIKNRLLLIIERIDNEIKIQKTLGKLNAATPIYKTSSNENLEKILGSNNLLKINWLQKAILTSKSVCQVRLINNDSAVGTGFVLKGGYLMTNCHVIPNQNAVDRVKIVFDFEEDLLGQVRKTFEYRLDRNDATFSPIAEFDYAYVKIIDNPANPLAQWGHLEIDTAVPQIEDPVTIIQHPLGQVKQIALTANKVIGINGQKLLYETDTEPGSSGSPVFNSNWKVIALHHAGKTEADGGLVINPATGEKRGANEGILMKNIAQKLTKLINP